MYFFEKYISLIEEQIVKANFPEKPRNLYDPLRYFMSIGGKRIRPMLTLMATELFGGKKEDAIDAALSIEMFHNFSLIHDDLMDNAPLRRNMQTVHEKWSPTIAILSGDVLLINAYKKLTGYSPEKVKCLIDAFNKTAIEVCEGQQLDVDFESLESVNTDEYIHMIRLKTSVLLGCALHLGAIIANASIQNQDLLYSFGVNIGIAFQIQDDILDLYADPEKFGKQIGGDVISNKKTILYVLAQQYANNQQIESLKELYSETNLSTKVEQTRALFDEIGVKEMAVKLMNDYNDKALDALTKISIDQSKKLELLDLSSYLLTREI